MKKATSGWVGLLALLGIAMMGPAAATSGTVAAVACGAGPAGDHPAGADVDLDGVPDSSDWCTRTPAGTRVGSNGCAAGEIAAACDKAPAPMPAKVVPVAMADDDGDRDGVPDKKDRCPNTPRGVEVDAKGCAEVGKVVLKGVNFATGSARLKPESHATLRSVADAMKANPKLEVEVRGYTDSVGDEAKNKSLSERRAEAVKVFLVSEGIDSDRLSTRGFGEADPVDTNDTADGRANNRRVSFRVTDS